MCVSVCVEMGVCVVGEKGNMYRECWRDKWGLWKERCVHVCVCLCVYVEMRGCGGRDGCMCVETGVCVEGEIGMCVHLCVCTGKMRSWKVRWCCGGCLCRYGLVVFERTYKESMGETEVCVCMEGEMGLCVCV